MAKTKRTKRKGPSFGLDRPSSKTKKKTPRPVLALKQVKFTVELPELTRRSLKVQAAMSGLSMRELLLVILKDAGIDTP